MMKLSLVLSLVCLTALTTADDSDDKIIYGTDDRIEFYEATAATQTLVRNSIVSLQTPFSAIDCTNTSNCVFQDTTSSNNLCAGERFAGQPVDGFCSGTLVAANKVLTAGHCISVQSDCDSMAIVFNYFYEANGTMATVSSDDVYQCQQSYKIELLSDSLEYIDYAVIVLDRDVVGHTPMTIATIDETRPAENTMLTLAGGPGGMPIKILENAAQYNDPERTTDGMSLYDVWYSEADTFGGNSGSGVFDSNGKIWGVLSAGNTDYVAGDGCLMDNVVADASEFDDAEKIVYPYRAVGLLEECSNSSDCDLYPGSSCTSGFCGNTADTTCGDARTVWGNDPSCCLPVTDDSSALCTAFKAADSLCQMYHFDLSAEAKTCEAGITFAGGQCHNNVARTCLCGPIACGVNLTAAVQALGSGFTDFAQVEPSTDDDDDVDDDSNTTDGEDGDGDDSADNSTDGGDGGDNTTGGTSSGAAQVFVSLLPALVALLQMH